MKPGVPGAGGPSEKQIGLRTEKGNPVSVVHFKVDGCVYGDYCRQGRGSGSYLFVFGDCRSPGLMQSSGAGNGT